MRLLSQFIMRRTSHFLQMRFAYSMGPMSVFCKATYIHFLFDGIYAAYSQCDVCCIERIFGLVFLLVLRTYVLRAISVERNISCIFNTVLIKVNIKKKKPTQLSTLNHSHVVAPQRDSSRHHTPHDTPPHHSKILLYIFTAA